MRIGIADAHAGDDAISRTHVSEITNELGNRIIIAAMADEAEVVYSLTGPNSTTENKITILEAIELFVALGDVLGVNWL